MNIAKDISSEALCTWIVAYRTVGALKEESKKAMQELLKRKEGGDTFGFDSYIKEKVKKVTPEPNMTLDELIEAMKNLETGTLG